MQIGLPSDPLLLFTSVYTVCMSYDLYIQSSYL